MTVKVKGKLPTIYITPLAKQKLDLYIECCKDEIAGFGIVDSMGNDFVVTDIFILEQDVSSAHADLSSEAISEYLVKMANEGFDLSRVKLFWHSHVNGGVFWSGTDEGSINGLSNSWMLSIVGNKKGEYLVRLDTYEFLRLTFDDLDFELLTEANEELKELIEEEIKDKVKAKSYGTVWGGYKGYNNNCVGYSANGAYENYTLGEIRRNKEKKYEEDEKEKEDDHLPGLGLYLPPSKNYWREGL